jgi:Tat protein translocase TatC
MRLIVDPVEDQLEKFEDRNANRKLAEYNAELKANPDVRRSVTNLKVEVNADELRRVLLGEPAQSPPVLDKMVRGFEIMLDDLDASKYLEKSVRPQGRFVEMNMTIVNPEVFNPTVMEAMKRIRPKRLSAMNITEAFMVYFKVAIMTGFVISSPWVFWQIWAFIAAGLYPHEKRLVHVYLPFSLFLFLSGAIVCQFLVMPKAIEALLWFNEWLGIGADLRLNEWLGFALMMPVVFGVSFQTPLVMMFFHKIGLLTVQTYRDKRRISWFLMAIFAAVITPSVDALSMLFLWVPMGLLYELGIILCVWQGENEALMEWEEEDRQKGELVEV